MAQHDHARNRLHQRLLPGGAEPDPRFSLANERTFLAWIRTALALMAGGIALEAFAPDTFDPKMHKPLVVILLLLGMLISVMASVRWLQVENALRQNRPLPIPILVPVLSLVGTIVTAGLLVFVVFR